jgi:UDPglucose 6-dehydrogenase
MNICVVGTGYVGLVTGAVFADLGNDVVCVDKDRAKIAALEAGRMPIYEPGLEEMVGRNAGDRRLSFTSDLGVGIRHADVIFIAVGTPPKDSGETDLSQVEAVAAEIGRAMDRYKVVVNKSTVPVGTGELVREVIARHQPRAIEFDVVSNPEFLKEGAAVGDFMRPDRIVVGSSDERATQIMRQLYAPLLRNHDRILVMDPRSAELTKYAANAMLATRISFMNELANLAEKLGANIESVRHGIGSDQRIGYHFLYAGVGYGGSCFPKDIKALQHTAGEYGMQLTIVDSVEKVNRTQKQRLLEKVRGRFGEQLDRLHFAVWGLSFKPNTDDMREAPSRVVINGLLARGATITVYDPVAMEEARKIFADEPGVRFGSSTVNALDGADALIIVTEWKEFRSPDFADMKKRMKSPVVFDGRNLYDPAMMKKQGFTYYAIGRGEPPPTN